MKDEKLWKFESDEIISRLRYCSVLNPGSNRTLTELISFHYPVNLFIDLSFFKNVMLSIEQSASSKTCDKVLFLSELLFKDPTIIGIQQYSEQLRNELLHLIDCEEILHSGSLLHRATLNIIVLSNAFNSLISVENYIEILNKSLSAFHRILESASGIYFEFGSIKIVESFINVSCCVFSIFPIFFFISINVTIN